MNIYMKSIIDAHLYGIEYTMPAVLYCHHDYRLDVIFWVVNFKTQNYFVISTTQNVYLRLSMYDCSNFVHSCRIFGISERQTV
jgi:hypothetical protein